MKGFRIMFAVAVLILSSVFTMPGGNLALAQSPPPQPPTGSQLPNLRPLAFTTVSLDGVARSIASFTNIPPPTPEFLMPRGAEKVFEFNTRDGRGNVNFSVALPSGVPQSAFRFVQQSVPAPNAVGRLEYNGCSTCPTTFTITVRAQDPSGTVSAQVKFELTYSTGRPRIFGMNRAGGTELDPRFEIGFAAGTFDPRDSQVVATYAGGLRYRLSLSPDSQIAQGRLQFGVPRLTVERAVTVRLVNPYGSSTGQDIQFSVQRLEVLDGNDQFVGDSVPPFSFEETALVRHPKRPLPYMVEDQLVFTPMQTGQTPCDQVDFIVTATRVLVVTRDSAATVRSEPPRNAPLRAPLNVVRVEARQTEPDLLPPAPLPPLPWFYSVGLQGVFVKGVCRERIIR